jgi:hypothetical protein
LSDYIVKAFKVLDIERGIDVDPGIQDLLNV